MLKMIFNFFKITLRTLGVFAELFVAFFVSFVFYALVVSSIPSPKHPDITVGEATKVSENHYTLGNNWLKKNDYGVWEMYIEGEAYERGVVYGKLAKKLVRYQEEVFVNQINELIPSAIWQRFLQLMLGFFNKDLPKHIPSENLQEIYGISESFDPQYDYIGTKYQRILNYHAAHDIGHALNNYSMVGCTSFSVKDSLTEDGNLLIGRNFDFYAGDDFAKEKLVLFVNPTHGIPFVSYAWAGFTGVASGMNKEGLSVTINASKSQLPTGTKTPIAIVTRRILQYASTLDEAIQIAKQFEVFVSETIMVSSAKENETILIEKAPEGMDVYRNHQSKVLCANHYQSDLFKDTKINKENIKFSDSKNRFDRLNELLEAQPKIDVNYAASILRNQYGLKKDSLGMGNPGALNQLIAHHSVIMQPSKRTIWISTSPYQIGKFIAYDLNVVFAKKQTKIISEIASDDFLKSKAYHDFMFFKKMKQKILKYVRFGKDLTLSPKEIQRFIHSNSYYYHTYELLGDYFEAKEQKSKSLYFYEKALQYKFPSLQSKLDLHEKIKELKQK